MKIKTCSAIATALLVLGCASAFDPNLRVVAFSSDPEVDTPQTLNVVDDGGLVPDKDDIDTCRSNTASLNKMLATLEDGQTLLFPADTTIWLDGDVRGSDLKNNVIRFDGTIRFQNQRKHWPKDDNGNVKECMFFQGLDNVTFTSSTKEQGGGVVDGRGHSWWGYINYLRYSENRPRLIHIVDARNTLVEYITWKDSPYWTFYAQDIADMVIRFSDIDARRAKDPKHHDLYEMGAFNTDGFDVAGKNVHIHDCNIWNDDDSICVKEMNGQGKNAQCSENMLFERINASGVGLTVGSIGSSIHHTCVRNITFRDCTMDDTFKGIYMKNRPASPGETSEITNVTYERITINRPTQWPIWIGPQQAIYKGACSLFWPFVPGQKCPVPEQTVWSNILLKDVTINNPKYSPGVVIGAQSNPMKHVVFDNVKVNKPGWLPWFKKYYKCENIEGIARGGTDPVPPCFKRED